MCNNTAAPKDDKHKIGIEFEPVPTDETMYTERKHKGWIHALILKIDELCCMSYATRQLLLETNDVLCSNLCFNESEAGKYRVSSFDEGEAACYLCPGRNRGWSPPERRRNQGATLPLQFVNEEGPTFYSKCHYEEISPTNDIDNASHDRKFQFDQRGGDELEDRTQLQEQRKLYRNSLFDAVPYEERQPIASCDI